MENNGNENNENNFNKEENLNENNSYLNNEEQNNNNTHNNDIDDNNNNDIFELYDEPEDLNTQTVIQNRYCFWCHRRGGKQSVSYSSFLPFHFHFLPPLF